MQEIQHTPPRRPSSLAKVEALVMTAPIDQNEKEKLTKEIKHV
jgi:hypothetical protein